MEERQPEATQQTSKEEERRHKPRTELARVGVDSRGKQGVRQCWCRLGECASVYLSKGRPRTGGGPRRNTFMMPFARSLPARLPAVPGTRHLAAPGLPFPRHSRACPRVCSPRTTHRIHSVSRDTTEAGPGQVLDLGPRQGLGVPQRPGCSGASSSPRSPLQLLAGHTPSCAPPARLRPPLAFSPGPPRRLSERPRVSRSARLKPPPIFSPGPPRLFFEQLHDPHTSAAPAASDPQPGIARASPRAAAQQRGRERRCWDPSGRTGQPGQLLRVRARPRHRHAGFQTG
ncbi:hypothetical protein NDU88_000238 [Pleurodeles waltl]|uniref:Uncharacterized protein n=1 Tax=Pleurodeles waltl TaxID=8319 RepID=A0AAV7S919_PLEWA|nr:hypothetical protein NDU88_000238 [Pleurodeles waltl]